MSIRPNFLLIGAAKSGTTALFQYLGRHPEVFLCDPKEPHFMAFCGRRPDFKGPYDEEILNARAVTDLDAYERLFAGAEGYRAIGEGSVSTLYYAEASIASIQAYTPKAKLLCVLRNPVDRAYSAFMYMVSLTRESVTDFEQAWELEAERIAAHYHHLWHYRQMGLYSRQLAPFMQAFPPEQLKIILYDDLRRDPLAVVKDCCQFLGIDPHHDYGPMPNALVSGRPRNAFLQKVLGRPAPWKELLRRHLPRWLTYGVRDYISKRNLVRDAIPAAMRARLTDFYAEDVHRLEELIGRDLSNWKAQ